MTAQFEPNMANAEHQPGADPPPELLDADLTATSRTAVAAPDAPPGLAAGEAIPTRPDSDQGTGSFLIPAHSGGRLRGKTVVVVGYGAVGPWTALNLALEGAQVHILDDGLFNTCATAAGWIAPYHATDPRAGRWGQQAVKLWNSYRGNLLPADAVVWEPTMFERTSQAPRFPKEFQQLPRYRPVARLGSGIAEAFTAETMVAPAQKWRPAITQVLTQMDNVEFHVRHVHDRDDMDRLAQEFEADFVIACTGIDEMGMYRDRDFEASYGLVVYLEMPEVWKHGVRARDLGIPALGGFGLPGATSDPYMITQRALGRIVVGGTMWPMLWRQVQELVDSRYEVDEVIADQVHADALNHFPELRGLKRVGAACSIRPCRTRFKFTFDPAQPKLLHINGFGGSGVTLAPVVGKQAVLSILDRISEQPRGC